MALRLIQFRPAIAACMALAIHGMAPRALAKPSEVFHGPGGMAGLLYRPALGASPSPAVLIVHDALGIDRRSQRYIAQLNAAGLLVLEVELGANAPDDVAEPLPQEAEAAAMVARAAAMLARDPRVDPARIGALGFGVGARAVALAPPAASGGATFGARLLLYPGCSSLHRLVRARPRAPGEIPPAILILHGDDDRANTPADCDRLSAAFGPPERVRRIAYRGATYAWDLPQAPGSECGRQPWPGGEGTVPTRSWPELADLTAAGAAAFFARALHPGAANLD